MVLLAIKKITKKGPEVDFGTQSIAALSRWPQRCEGRCLSVRVGQDRLAPQNCVQFDGLLSARTSQTGCLYTNLDYQCGRGLPPQVREQKSEINTTQYSIQYNTIQYNTIQYNHHLLALSTEAKQTRQRLRDLSLFTCHTSYLSLVCSLDFIFTYLLCRQRSRDRQPPLRKLWQSTSFP